MRIENTLVGIVTEQFRKYSEWTATTSVHKSREEAIMCCLLGMVGELSEYLEVTEEEDFAEKSRAELGDILWYIGHFVYRIGVIDEISISRSYDILNDGVSNIGRLAELSKKVIRDSDFDFKASPKYGEILKTIGRIVGSIWNECSDNNWDFIELMEENVAKLESRKERNVLQGSGDDR